MRVDELVNKSAATDRNRRVARNRFILASIIECILYLGRNGLSLRGHEEDEESPNKGNFLELLDLHAQKDPKLAHHLKHGAG